MLVVALGTSYRGRSSTSGALCCSTLSSELDPAALEVTASRAATSENTSDLFQGPSNDSRTETPARALPGCLAGQSDGWPGLPALRPALPYAAAKAKWTAGWLDD